MARIPRFEVEHWMNTYETTPGVLNIAETCSASISIDELRSLSDDKSTPPINTSTILGYGTIPGSDGLRQLIAKHHGGEEFKADNVIVSQGAISANFLTLFTLLGKGDHVVCVHPTYQQLYEVPRALGAEVTLWELKAEDSFVPKTSELPGLTRENTKVCLAWTCRYSFRCPNGAYR